MDLYYKIAVILRTKAFKRWLEDPDEPRRWADVLEFLGADEGGDDAPECFREIQKTVKGAMQWCSDKDVAYLTKDPIRLHPPIHFRELAELSDFLGALTYRFPRLEGGQT